MADPKKFWGRWTGLATAWAKIPGADSRKGQAFNELAEFAVQFRGGGAKVYVTPEGDVSTKARLKQIAARVGGAPGPGRPSLTGSADGTVQLTVRLTRDQAARLDELDEAHKLGGRAGTVRWAIDRV